MLPFPFSREEQNPCPCYGRFTATSALNSLQLFSFSLTVYFLLTLIPVFRDFPVSPVVKTSPSNAGGAGLIPGQGTKIPQASGPKN